MRKTMIVVATAALAIGSTSLPTPASAFGLLGHLGGFGLIHPGLAVPHLGGLGHPGFVGHPGFLGHPGFGPAHIRGGYGLGHLDDGFGGRRAGGWPYRGGYARRDGSFYRGYAYGVAPLYGAFGYNAPSDYGGYTYDSVPYGSDDTYAVETYDSDDHTDRSPRGRRGKRSAARR